MPGAGGGHTGPVPPRPDPFAPETGPAPAPWPDRLSEVLGPVERAGSLGGSVERVRVAGRDLVVKTGPGVGDEAAGLLALAGVDGPPVPAVVLLEPGLLVTTWVDQGPRTAGHEEGLGRSLARLHRAPWPQWGGGSSWIGGCPVDPEEQPDAVSFYRTRLLGLAERCDRHGPVAAVADRLAELLPPGGPALLHGDLWWGNVLWGAEGRPWLVDPSVHGGHPEEDLAMLGLFGTVPDRLLAAYRELRALDPGWEERVDLFRLVPLLVHTVLFGGGYGAQVDAVLRRYR
jgi:fructosamine-3-kinase